MEKLKPFTIILLLALSLAVLVPTLAQDTAAPQDTAAGDIVDFTVETTENTASALDNLISRVIAVPQNDLARLFLILGGIVLLTGEERWISLKSSPIRDENDQIHLIVNIFRDITQRVQLAALVAQQRKRLETILNSVPGIVFESADNLDTNERQITFVSEYAETMLGYPLAEWHAVPDFWRQVIHPDDLDRTMQQIQHLRKNGKQVKAQFRCITKDGKTLHVESHTALIYDDAGKPIGTCGVVMDITERKQIQDEVLNLTLVSEMQRHRLNNRVRWCKKPDNWLAFIQLAAAHILLDRYLVLARFVHLSRNSILGAL